MAYPTKHWNFRSPTGSRSCAFLRIDLSGAVPNPTTVWLFRERLREAKIFQRLFEQFHRALSSQRVKLKRGQIVDASFVEAPRQCNTRKENETIKDGAVPAQWTMNPATLRQRDVDARWTQKNDEDHYGDKIHVSVDRKTKLVIEEQVMAANVHDSQVFAEVLGMGKKRGRGVGRECLPQQRARAAAEAQGVSQPCPRACLSRPAAECPAAEGESHDVPRAGARGACLCGDDANGRHDGSQHRD